MNFDLAGKQIQLPFAAVIVSGFTGRDQDQVRAHVAELAAEGVPAPARVPSFYLVPPSLLTQAAQVKTTHAQTSGEVEIGLLASRQETFVTLASDHTDRAAETIDIGLSKQLCPKVVASSVWPLAEVAGHWDALEMRSWIEENGRRVLYQHGRAADLLAPDELLARIPFKQRPDCLAILMGTLPAIGGIRPAAHFWAELFDPHRNQTLRLDYTIQDLSPVLSTE